MSLVVTNRYCLTSRKIEDHLHCSRNLKELAVLKLYHVETWIQLIMVEHFEVFHSVHFCEIDISSITPAKCTPLCIMYLCHVSATCFGLPHTIFREAYSKTALYEKHGVGV